MDILIPDSWLRDFLKTEAKPEQIAKALSLCSLSVDRVTESGDGDSIYHIEVPPNRYDCLSVLGIACEAAAALPRFNHPAELITKDIPSVSILSGTTPVSKGLLIKPEITDSKLCPRFSAIVIENVKIAASPKVVRDRLEKAGIRALNNVIDITNYVMLELGQPMHAFDFDKLATINNSKEKIMRLRSSRSGEKLKTLDGTTREIPAGSIVIDDGEKIIDLCGIMGGENSAISPSTTKVILFAQIYDPVTVRKTSMSLPLRTEAVQRFEKGLDPEMVLPSLAQSIKMAAVNANSTVASPLIDINSQPFKPHTVKMTKKRLEQYLSINMEHGAVISILESLGIQTTFNFELLTFNCLIPSFRDKDINIEEDLIEEVARLYGYHNLPVTLPVGQISDSQVEPVLLIENRVKNLLKGLGFTEIINLSLTSKDLAGDGKLVKVLNPLGPETEYLVADPFPLMIEAVKKNLSRLNELRIFEMGNAFRPQDKENLPHDTDFLTLAILSPFFTDTERAFLEIKGLAETIFKELSVRDYVFKDFASFPYQYTMPLDTNNSFIINAEREIKSGKIVGVGGQSSAISNLWLIKVNLRALEELINPRNTFVPLPSFPPITEEVSFFLPVKKTYQDAVTAVKTAGGKLLEEVSLSDIYTDQKLQEEGKRSLTLKLSFHDPKKTLTSEEIKPLREKILKDLEKKLGAQPRVN